MSNFNTIVLPGCGGNIVYILGYIYNLILKNQLNLENITNFFGISSGTILCVLIAIDLTIKDIFTIFLTNNTFKTNSTSLLDFQSFLKNIFADIFKKKHISKKITFSEFKARYDKSLNFVSFDIDSKNGKIFNYKTTPDIKIIEAVSASCSIPIIFDNYTIDNCKYIDGIFYDTLPVEFLQYDNSLKGIKIFSFSDYFLNHHRFIINKLRKFHNKIDVHLINAPFFLNIFISKKNIKKMFVIGFFNSKENKFIHDYQIYFYALKKLMD